jgi:ATP-dependent Lhr-like helicase
MVLRCNLTSQPPLEPLPLPIPPISRELKFFGSSDPDQAKTRDKSNCSPKFSKCESLKNFPQILITTPESLHLLITNPSYPQIFKHLKGIVVDEWHEMVGSKRGVQMQLALALLSTLVPKLQVWGISATIGNLDEAADVLLGTYTATDKRKWIGSTIEKKIDVEVEDVITELIGIEVEPVIEKPISFDERL